MINYRINANHEEVREWSKPLYSYILGSNGVFIKAIRDLIYATVPVLGASQKEQIRGLQPVRPMLHLHPQIAPVKSAVVAALLANAQKQHNALDASVEILYYLTPYAGGNWQVNVPKQVQKPATCYPLNKTGQDYQQCLLELHSHHAMSAVFSQTDNLDEQGFRFYAVIGSIFQSPQIRLRLGIYGHFYEIPASVLFELPEGVSDCNPVENYRNANYNLEFYRGGTRLYGNL